MGVWLFHTHTHTHMEGINRSKHQILTGALANYIQFLAPQRSEETSNWLRELNAKQKRLDELHTKYIILLSQLEAVTEDYHEEASESRIRLLCRRVKKYKASLEASDPGARALALCVSLQHGA